MAEINFEKDVIQRLTRIETQINNGMVKKQDDHEKRIRFLERGFYIAFGGLAILQIALTFVGNFLFK